MTIRELVINWLDEYDRTGYWHKEITLAEAENFVDLMDFNVVYGIDEYITPKAFMDVWNDVIRTQKASAMMDAEQIARVQVKQSWTLVPLSDFPFGGDFVLIENKTEKVLFDSRIDGYDCPYTNYLISWATVEKDDSVPERAIFKFTVIDPNN